MRCSARGLRLVGKLDSEAVSEHCNGSRNALGVTRLVQAVCSSAEERNVLVLLYTEDATGHTRDRNQNQIFKGKYGLAGLRQS